MAYYKYGKWEIPDRMKSSIENYLKHRIRPGSFLTSVLENNFTGAIAYADKENLENLPAYGYWLMNEIPFEAWGSKEKVIKWLKGGK